MAKSQQTFNKSEKEKKRLKKREDKRKKMEARKLEKEENGGAESIPFAYVDQFGNLTDTPPDPSEKIKVSSYGEATVLFKGNATLKKGIVIGESTIKKVQ